MGRVVGIDLGTTFSALATLGATGKPEIIRNAEGDRFTPSVVYLGAGGPLVGAEAKEMQALGEEEVVSFFKRGMGDRNAIFLAEDRHYTPTDLSSLVLLKLKADTEQVLGESISDAVITVPAYFSDLQRRNTIEAGRLAGLNVLRIINEPTAAAIAYGMEHTFKEGARVLVYDLGGGTFDVTLVQVSKDAITVLATDGNHELGGKDWDDVILRHVATKFEEEHGLAPLADSAAFNDLMVRAETVKKKLSSTLRTTFLLEHEGVQARYELSRVGFEEMTDHLMEMTLALTEQVLLDVGCAWSDLDEILCVGGSTRMPMVHRYLKERSGLEPLRNVDVDAAVAFGAAIQAHLDAQPTWGLPGKSSESETHYLGPQKVIRDVMSHSLGMVAINEERTRYINTILIPKNQAIPSEQTRPYQFKTRAYGTNEMEVYITQGESDHPLSCDILGKYRFLDIPHHTGKGKTVLDISYAYDRNGVVQVSATDRHSGQQIKSVVEPVSGDLSWMDEPPEQVQVVEHVSLILAIDLSGSMSGNPLRKAQKAAKGFISQMDLAHTSLGLIAVADTVQVVQGLCQNARKMTRAIDSLSIGQVGIGNAGQPFSKALELLKDRGGLRFLLVLADGVWSRQNAAIEKARQCHAHEIEVVAIGFGSADEAFLKAIASSEEGALFTNLNQLAGSFDRVAQVITESGGVGAPSSGSTAKRGLLFFFT